MWYRSENTDLVVNLDNVTCIYTESRSVIFSSGMAKVFDNFRSTGEALATYKVIVKKLSVLDLDVD